MPNRNEAKRLIHDLQNGRLNTECPNCNGNFRLQDAGLFHGDDFTEEATRAYQGKTLELHVWRHDLREQRKEEQGLSERLARAVNAGFILERLVPAMQGFEFKAADCRPLGEPIDLVIFDGLSRKRRIDQLVFADVKSGSARLTEAQKQIRDAVEKKNVVLRTYNVGEVDED